MLDSNFLYHNENLPSVTRSFYSYWIMLQLHLLYIQSTIAQVFAFWSNFANEKTSKWVPKTCILRFSTSFCEGFVATPFRSDIYGTSLEMRIKSAKKELAIPWNLDLTLGQWLAKCVRPLLKCYYCSLYWLPGNRGTCRCSHVMSWTSG